MAEAAPLLWRNSQRRRSLNMAPDSRVSVIRESRRSLNMGTRESGRGSEAKGEDKGEDKGEAAQWTVESISRMAANDDALGKEIGSIRRAQTKAPRLRRSQLAGAASSSDLEPEMSLTRRVSWQPGLSLLPLSPGSRARLLLDMLAVLNAFFSAAWFPLASFFVPDSCDSFSYRLGVTLGYISSVLGLLDVAAGFVTAFYEDGNLVISPREIACAYLQGWFALDLFANVPLHSLSIVAVRGLEQAAGATACPLDTGWRHWLAFAGVNHLLRLARLERVLRGVSSGFVARVTAKVGINPSLLRLLCLFTAMSFAFHCIACYWWHVRRAAYELHDSERSGVELGAFGDSDEMILRALAERDPHPLPISSLYALALFWSVTTSMGFEPPILPTTAAEQLYTVAVVLFGVVVAAFVVGSATSIVASMDAISSKRKHELRLLEQYMHSRQVPHALRQRVVGFYEYVTGALASPIP